MTGINIGTLIADNPLLPDFFPNDPILSGGSLFLIEFQHTKGGPSTGIPTTGALIPNIAHEVAAEIIGSGDETTLAGEFTKTAADQIVFERTAKGGLHGAVSNTTMNTSVYATIDMPDLIKTYLLDNPTHDIYVSLWGAKTRLSTNTATSQLVIGANLSQSSNYLLRMLDTIQSGTGNGGLGVRYDGGPNALGKTYQSVGTNAWSGTPPAGASGMADLIQWGRAPGQTSLTNVFGSFVVYRAYIEDMTVSGRSYSDVDATDHALYQAAIGPGGRYNDDTWTAPAALVA